MKALTYTSFDIRKQRVSQSQNKNDNNYNSTGGSYNKKGDNLFFIDYKIELTY